MNSHAALSLTLRLMISMSVRLAARLALLGAIFGAGFGFLVVGGLSLLATEGATLESLNILSVGTLTGMLVASGLGLVLGSGVGAALGLITARSAGRFADHTRYIKRIGRASWLLGLLGWLALASALVLTTFAQPDIAAICLIILAPALIAARATRFMATRLAYWHLHSPESGGRTA